MNVQIYDFKDELVELPVFQLLQWKHAIGLEMKGLKNSRGSVTAHVRRKLSAPKNYPRKEIHKHLSDSLDDINKQLQEMTA